MRLLKVAALGLALSPLPALLPGVQVPAWAQDCGRGICFCAGACRPCDRCPNNQGNTTRDNFVRLINNNRTIVVTGRTPRTNFTMLSITSTAKPRVQFACVGPNSQ